MNKKCPLCDKDSSQNHLKYCKENKNNIPLNELKRMYLEYNFPNIFTYDNLLDVYVNKKMSLPDIKEKYGVSYNLTLFMLEQYNISKRGYSAAAISSMDKREKTNFKKYGAKNVLSKGTIKYDKKNSTVKEKYGVDNVFQIKQVIDKINNDNYYLDKYGLTKSDLFSLNSKIMWKKMSKEEREVFLDKCNKKRNETWYENYGGHPLKNEEIKDKIIKKNNEKYGCDYLFQSDFFKNNLQIKEKSRKSLIEKGLVVPDNLLLPFDLYKRECRRLTSKIKNRLFEKWDGHDYYDGEFIKTYLSLKNTDKNYPTIDHKISIYYGFINDISVDEICHIDNLCITKRSINSSKRHKLWKDIIK